MWVDDFPFFLVCFNLHYWCNKDNTIARIASPVMANFVTISKKHGLQWEKEHAGLEVRWVIWAKVVVSSAGRPLCLKRESMNFRVKVVLLLQEYEDKPWNMDFYLPLKGDAPLTSLATCCTESWSNRFWCRLCKRKNCFLQSWW